MLRRFMLTLPKLPLEDPLTVPIRARCLGVRSYFLSLSSAQDRPTSITSQLLANSSVAKPDPLAQLAARRHVIPEPISLAKEKQEDAVVTELKRQIKDARNLDELEILLEQTTLEKTLDDELTHRFLNSLFSLSRGEKSEAGRKDILSSIVMQKLCKVLRTRGRWLDTDTLMNAAKVLVLLGAPPSNTTLQIMFRLLSKQANQLSLKEITYLHFLLDRTAETALVKALKLALPVVFETQLASQLEKDNAQLLVDSLCYACRYEIADNNIQLIINALVALALAGQLTPRQAAVILWEMSALNELQFAQNNNFELLKQSCFTTITNSIDSLSANEINTTITKLSKRVHNAKASTTSFYNDDFVEAVCNTLVTRKEKMLALWSAKNVSLMRHVNIEYLDYIADVLVEDPSILLNHDRLYLSLVRVFSMANYKPESLKVLEHVLGEHPALTKDMAFQEVTIAADLLALDIFPNSLISRLFSENYFLRLDTFLKSSSPHLLMVMYNAVKYLYPSYQGPFPPISMVESWKNRILNLPKQYQLKAALESGFGGDKYVISGLLHEGFHIDHGIVMRKGGFPMAINDRPRHISELQLPPDSIIVMMKAFLPESYANNTNRMRGVSALELRIIEKFGHPVIPIDIKRWQALQDYEKIPFLMHKVRDVVDKHWKGMM